MASYIMSEFAEAVAKTVKLADELEIKYRRYINGDEISKEDCIHILDALMTEAEKNPFDIGGLPKMINDYICSDDKDAKALIPVIEGFVGMCRNNYLDHFNDSPEGGLKEVSVEDYFGNEKEKHALIVYIVSPFMENMEIKGHTNAQDARSMAEVLDELGYSVDIINPWYTGRIDHERYDLVIGFRKAFEDMLPLLREDCVKIYYLTTMNSYVANMAEVRRVEGFYLRNKMRPAYRRLEYSCMDLERIYMCDGAICLGNGYTVSTYKGMFKEILPQNVSGFRIDVERNNDEPGRDFMWYGGAGSLHKGVDLCIEAFRDLPDCNLHIVGRLEDDIFEFYKDELERSPNVIYHGFMYRDDAEFTDLCKNCSFSIGVSCSEGQSTAMLTSIFAGLIPVCNDETGIDTEEYGGIRIDSTEIKYLSEKFKDIAKMPEEEISQRRTKGLDRVKKLHTKEAYKEQLKNNIKTIVSGECE